FEMGEIDLRIESLAEAKTKGDPADVLPAAEGCAPVSQADDVWQLGRHRLVCGSALDPGAYAVLMQGERAAMVFTDPPYNVPVHGHVCGLGAIRHREFAMASGEMSELEFTNFLTGACKLLVSHSLDGAIHYLCMDWRHLGEVLGAGKAVYG